MTLTSGIFFSYSSQNDLEYLSRILTDSSLDRIILAVGGDIALPESASNEGRSGIHYMYENSRLGKSASYNRALQEVESGIVFLASGDVRFDPSIFEKCVSRFSSEVGMVIPRVVPDESGNIVERIGAVMWHIHDVFMEYMSSSSQFFCGGEFQAVKNPGPLVSPDIVNDDEFICHQIYSAGKKIVYAEDLVVTNYMPSTLIDLLRQRIRVNFGHMQSRSLNEMHSSISIKGFDGIIDTIRILAGYFRKYRKECFLFPIACIVESISLVLAKHAFTRGRSYRYWHLGKRG